MFKKTVKVYARFAFIHKSLSGVEICDEGLKAFILTKLFLCEQVYTGCIKKGNPTLASSSVLILLSTHISFFHINKY